MIPVDITQLNPQTQAMLVPILTTWPGLEVVRNYDGLQFRCTICASMLYVEERTVETARLIVFDDAVPTIGQYKPDLQECIACVMCECVDKTYPMDFTLYR